MAFKPLGMETVMESDERRLSPMAPTPYLLEPALAVTSRISRLQSDASLYAKKKGLMNL